MFDFQRFKRICEDMGGDYDEPFEGGVTCTNDKGQTIGVSDISDEQGEVHEVYFENVDFDVDNKPKPRDVRMRDGSIVVEGISVYKQTSMYGGTAKRGDLEFGPRRINITESI